VQFSPTSCSPNNRKWKVFCSARNQTDPWGPWGIRTPWGSQCTVSSTKERRQRARTVCTRNNKELHGECFSKHRCELQNVGMHCFT
jgi:hypothetical protein